MISKKLLNEVLGTKVRFKKDFKDHIWYKVGSSSKPPHTWNDIEINIYELAHKCKEWARDNKYNTFTSFTYESMCWLDRKKEWICRIDTGSQEHDFFADTEPEAIFKACEWIKENK